MAVIPLGFAQVNIIFGGIALPLGAQITFGVENIADAAPGVVAGLVEDAWTAAGMPARMTSNSTLTGILVKKGPNATGNSEQVGFNIPGTGNALNVTPQVCAVVRKFTALGGRKGRGRFFLPGLAEGSVTNDGRLEAAAQAALQTSVGTFFSRLDTDGIPMVLLHSETGGFADLPGTVTGLVVDSQTGTQRRRNRR